MFYSFVDNHTHYLMKTASELKIQKVGDYKYLVIYYKYNQIYLGDHAIAYLFLTYINITYCMVS